MAGTFLLEVVTPEKMLLSNRWIKSSPLAKRGDFGVCRGELYFLIRYARTVADALSVGADQPHGNPLGLLRKPPTKMTIMGGRRTAEDIDVGRAQAAVEKAEERLKAGGLPSEVKEAEISLEKARLRKKIADRARKTDHA